MPVADAGDMARAGDIRHDFNAGLFQTFFELLILRRAAQSFVHQDLHGHFCGRFTRTNCMFDFTFRQGTPNRFPARINFGQPILFFQLAHDLLLPVVILGV